MTGWMILAAVLAAFALLSAVRLGVQATYGKEGLVVKARLGLIRVTVFRSRKKPGRGEKRRPPDGKRVAPKPEKKKAAGRRLAGQEKERAPAPEAKRAAPDAPARAVPSAQEGGGTAVPAQKPPQQDAPAQQDAPRQEGETRSGGLPLPLMDLIDFGLDAAGELISRLQIDTLEVDYTIAGKRDPASAAIQYGVLCAGGGALVALLENSFYRIRRREIRAQVDFEGTEPLIWLSLALSLRLGQLVVLACRLGAAFYRKLQKQRQEDKEHGTEASDQ